MKEFKLAGYVKFFILAFLVIIPIVLAGLVITSQLQMEMLLLIVILFVFAVYLFKVFVAINKDIFKKIVIDKSTGKFLLITAKKEVLSLPFENVVAVNMAKGSVLRGIDIGHVTIITKEQKAYGVTISNIDKFYVESPKEIEQTLDDAIFYHPKWNNL